MIKEYVKWKFLMKIQKEIKHMVNGNCLFQRGDLYEVNTIL